MQIPWGGGSSLRHRIEEAEVYNALNLFSVMVGKGKSAIVKSSQVSGLRDRVAIIRALLHAISFPHPYASYGDLSEVGR